VNESNRTFLPAARLGMWSALLTALLALVTFAIAILTLPISGPFCQVDCISYPYAEIASRVPRDYYWMYTAILTLFGLVVMAAALHACTATERRIYSQVALIFGTVAVALLTADYYVQIATLQPSTLLGESEGVAILTQYNPHGVFIALEDIGYFLLALAFVFAALGFTKRNGLERSLRWLPLTGGLLTIASWFVLYAIYGFDLEYRFEVISFSIDYLLIIVAGALLTFWFRQVMATADRQ
jgi:hypothetical protein